MATKKTKTQVSPKKAPKKAVKKPVKKAVKKVTKKSPAKVTKKAVKKTPVKKVASKKTAVKKTAKKKVTIKKTAVKKTVKKKVTIKKTAPKKTAKKKVLARKTTAKKVVKQETKKPPSKAQKISKTVSLNSERSPDKKNVTHKQGSSMVFSLEDVEALVANRKDEAKENTRSNEKQSATQKLSKQSNAVKKSAIKTKPVKAQKHSAASIADILGFNPVKKESASQLMESEIPTKWKRYYKLLIELRTHVKDELALHTAETLKQSSKENSGDLSGYGSHQADAGTDTFDRDFALGILSTEHDALNEIEEAIYRIKDGSYGICEQTGKAIKKERLSVVPFTRFSLEGQIEFEKKTKKRRDRVQAGLFEDNSDALSLGSMNDDE